MTRIFYLAMGLLLLGACTKDRYDLIIRNAVVVDGSGNKSFKGDVGINKDTIAAVGDLSKATGAKEIDAAGLVLSPGFIDSHSHHDRGMFENREMIALTSQGVTTMIVGQDGGSQFPISKFFGRLDSLPVALNVGSYTGHNRIRRIILGDKFQRVSTQEEVDGMINLLKEDLNSGSLGLSTGLEYDPGVYSNSDEVVQLAKALKPSEARYISHIRSEDRALWQALNEIINVGKAAEVPVQISHAKLAMKSLWGQSDKMIIKLDSARSAGIDITADLYPYRYWQSSMRAVFFPDRNFKDRNAATFALTELTTPEGVILNNYSPEPSYAGKTLAEISTIRKTNPVQTLLDLVDEVEKQGGDESIIATSMMEDDIMRIMKWSFTNICSDGNSDGLHPRGHGSFTKILRFYVNETKTLTLEEAIHKMTKQTADNLNLKKMGEIMQGNFADLVLFDPNTVADQATNEQPHALSTGISRVFVSGVEVFAEGNATHQYPGRTIRRDK